MTFGLGESWTIPLFLSDWGVLFTGFAMLATLKAQ